MDSNSSAADIARVLAARRKRVEGVCPICGATFVGTTYRRYCSGRCRMRAHRAARDAVEERSSE